MTSSRRTIQALSSQLLVGQGRKIVIVEGESDRDAIKLGARTASMPVDIYYVGDFDVKLDPAFAKYGGNKGRVLSLIADPILTPFAADRLIGIVDRDIDDYLLRVVQREGVLYTIPASLFCHVVRTDDIRYLVEVVFRRHIDDQEAIRCIRHSQRLLRIRAAIKLLGGTGGMVNIKKYCEKGYLFNWKSYFDAVAQKNSLDRGVLFERFLGMGQVDGLLDYHFFVEILWHLGRAGGAVPSTVTLEEMGRAFFHRYVLQISQCPTFGALSAV